MDSADARLKRIDVRVSPAIKTKLETQAKALGIPLTHYVTRLVSQKAASFEDAADDFNALKLKLDAIIGTLYSQQRQTGAIHHEPLETQASINI